MKNSYIRAADGGELTSRFARRQPTLQAADGGSYRNGRGGQVPGTGTGDKVKALYEPSEFVVSNDMLDASPHLREQLHGLRAQVLAQKGMTPEMADEKAMSGGTLRAAGGYGLEPYVNHRPYVAPPPTPDRFDEGMGERARAQADARAAGRPAPDSQASRPAAEHRAAAAAARPTLPPANAPIIANDVIKDPAKPGRFARTVSSLGRGVGVAGAGTLMADAMGGQVDFSGPSGPRDVEGSTARYAKRFGMSEPTGDGSAGDIAKFVTLRGLGYASDLGNTLTGGLAGKYLYRDKPGLANTSLTAAGLTSAPTTPLRAAYNPTHFPGDATMPGQDPGRPALRPPAPPPPPPSLTREMTSTWQGETPPPTPAANWAKTITPQNLSDLQAASAAGKAAGYDRMDFNDFNQKVWDGEKRTVGDHSDRTIQGVRDYYQAERTLDDYKFATTPRPATRMVTNLRDATDAGMLKAEQEFNKNRPADSPSSLRAGAKPPQGDPGLAKLEERLQAARAELTDPNRVPSTRGVALKAEMESLTRQIESRNTQQTTLRGQDLEHAGRQATALTASLRAQQEQLNSNRTYAAGRDDAADARKGTALTRETAKSTAERAMFDNMFNVAGKDNKQERDQGKEAAAYVEFNRATAGGNTGRSPAQMHGDAVDYVNLLASARDHQNNSLWQKFGWGDKDPQHGGMPPATEMAGATASTIGFGAGAAGMNMSRGDYQIALKNGRTMIIGRKDMGEAQIALLKRQGVIFQGDK